MLADRMDATACSSSAKEAQSMAHSSEDGAAASGATNTGTAAGRAREDRNIGGGLDIAHLGPPLLDFCKRNVAVPMMPGDE